MQFRSVELGTERRYYYIHHALNRNMTVGWHWLRHKAAAASTLGIESCGAAPPEIGSCVCRSTDRVNEWLADWLVDSEMDRGSKQAARQASRGAKNGHEPVVRQKLETLRPSLAPVSCSLYNTKMCGFPSCLTRNSCWESVFCVCHMTMEKREWRWGWGGGHRPAIIISVIHIMR